MALTQADEAVSKPISFRFIKLDHFSSHNIPLAGLHHIPMQARGGTFNVPLKNTHTHGNKGSFFSRWTPSLLTLTANYLKPIPALTGHCVLQTEDGKNEK